MVVTNLKFAVKHKALLNRSASTYWEEEISFRVNLAKSKYAIEGSKTDIKKLETLCSVQEVNVNPENALPGLFSLIE